MLREPQLDSLIIVRVTHFVSTIDHSEAVSLLNVFAQYIKTGLRDDESPTREVDLASMGSSRETDAVAC